MNANLVRQSTLGIAAGLVFLLGCARPSAQSEQPRTVVASAPIVVAQAVPADQHFVGPPAPSTPAPNTAQPGPAAVPTTVTDTNAPAIIERIPAMAKPENVALSPGLTEVVKLAQAGVGEDVILAFVEKYADTFNVGSDQILYLNDLGVSSTVITSMLKHDGSSAVAAAPAPAAVQTQAVSNVPANQVYAQPPPQVETAVAPPTASTEVSYFYDSLSPYGSWMYLSGYGWCWQPTVAVAAPAWRPYSDRGRWYWSDAGWYWNSDYSWGWAAFHYGRWYHHARSGWVWTPGLTWAPSWVSWRYSDGYCGWAPLPPEAHFRHGVGFTYHGRGVSVGFDFGLHDYHYSFVSTRDFCDYSPSRHFVPRNRTRDVYRNTTVVNNYIVGNNNTIINRGIGRETIARVGQTPIREVSVRERPVRNLANARSERVDQVERRGNESVVYRPQLPQSPPQVRTASFVTRGQGVSTVGRANNNASGNAQPITVNRTPVGGGITGGQPAATLPSRSGRATETQRAPEPQRGQTAVTRNNNSGAVTAPRVAPNANTQPRLQPGQQPQQQPQRGGRSLFGDSGANGSVPPQQNPVPQRNVAPQQQNAPTQRGVSVPQQNRTAVARGIEQRSAAPAARVQAPPSSGAPAARTYPQASAPVRQQSAPATVSPRAYEQAPRVATPSYSAPAVSVPRSAPSGGSGSAQPAVRQSSGGGGRSESAPSRGERGDRGR